MILAICKRTFYICLCDIIIDSVLLYNEQGVETMKNNTMDDIVAIQKGFEHDDEVRDQAITAFWMALVMMAEVDIFGKWMQAAADVSKGMEAEQRDRSSIFLVLNMYADDVRI